MVLISAGRSPVCTSSGSLRHASRKHASHAQPRTRNGRGHGRTRASERGRTQSTQTHILLSQSVSQSVSGQTQSSSSGSDERGKRPARRSPRPSVRAPRRTGRSRSARSPPTRCKARARASPPTDGERPEVVGRAGAPLARRYPLRLRRSRPVPRADVAYAPQPMACELSHEHAAPRAA